MRIAMGGAAALTLLFLMAPVLALVPMSFSGTRWLTLPPSDLSLRWYAELVTDRDWRQAIGTSLAVGASATVVAAVLGTLAGAALARARFPGREVVRGVVLAPLIVPAMLLAIAFYHLFARLGLVGTATALVLAHAVLAVPYVVLNVEAVMRTFDRRLERAARMLGASAWQAFRLVTLPLTRVGVLVGALFAFITSFDEVVVAMFLSGSSAITLPKLMWDSITQDELSPVVTAVASLQIALALAVFGTAEILRARGARLAWAWSGADAGDGPSAADRPARVLAVGTPPAGAGRPLSTEALRLVRLGKRFGPVVALEETTLQVEPGEFLTILGPSGSGKTTLLNLVAGFEAPTTGEVWLGDRSLTAEPPNRRNVGMVFQHYALFPHMTVFANVAFPLRLRKLPPREVRARVEEMLELVQLAGLGDRHPRELSGGQQQRVALARALVFRPPLLLMDEPFGALDAHLRSRMQAELRQVHRRLGVTVLFVTHDQEEAMAMADRIAVMARGRLQQLGTARELYERPANAFVAGFVGESNLLRGTLSRAVDGALRLITAGGAELALPPGAPAAAGAATVLVRPEALRITLDGPGGRTGLPGTVEEALYLGPLRKYTVRINPAEALTVRQPGEPGARELAAGDRVRVEWDPRDLRLL